MNISRTRNTILAKAVTMKTSSFSGSLNSPPIKDLKVTIQDSSMIRPPLQEQHYTHSSPYYLSNFDQVQNYYIRTVHFFTANQSFKSYSAVEALRGAVTESLLGPFHFLAGKLTRNANDKLEIDLNELVGIEFLVAQSEFALHEIEDLAYPHPAFKEQLVITYPTREDENPFVGFQVTKFKCGGFCMGITFSHLAFDGFGYKVYLQYLADLAANKPSALAPFTDRHVLASRRPLQVTFPHIEIDPHVNVTSPSNDTTNLDVKVFRITYLDINKLKRKVMEQALAEGKSCDFNKISGFRVLSALIWICKALSNPETPQNPNRLSTVFLAMDVRSLVNPPMPEGYAGNAVLTAHATSSCNELNMSNFCKVVCKVIEGGAKMTNEYVRSANDCLELRKGFPAGECIISTCCKLGYEKIKYPWGKSKYTWVVEFDRRNVIMLFPEVRNDDDDEELNNNCSLGQGANILVSLPLIEMAKFEELFNQFMLELKTCADKCDGSGDNRPHVMA